MRAWMMLPLLVACSGGDPEPEADDTDVAAADDTDAAGDDTDTPAAGDDTDPPADDTDDETPPAPYDFQGTWPVVSDAYGAASQNGYPCQPVGADTPWAITSLEWRPGVPADVLLTGSDIRYTCTVTPRQNGQDLVCSPNTGWFVDRGDYDLLYDYPMTASLNDDGTGSFTRRVETTCQGNCAGVAVCAWQDEIFQLQR